MAGRVSGMSMSALTALSIVLCAALPCTAQTPDYTIRTKTTEVQLEFSVTDRSGHRVLHLTEEDIAVVDNGEVIRHFRSFRSAQELPVHLVIIIDNSDSMAKRLARTLDGVSKILTSDIWGKNDRVSVLAFKDTRVVSICLQDCQREGSRVLQGIGGTRASPLFDAVVSAAKLLEQTRDPQYRLGILVITDGMDNISLNTSSSSLAAVQAIGAPIYMLGVEDERLGLDGNNSFSPLAELSGGFLLPMQSSITVSLALVLQDMRECFILSYELPHGAQRRHSVSILPRKDPQLIFRSRLGYGGN